MIENIKYISTDWAIILDEANYVHIKHQISDQILNTSFTITFY